jgi:hypothetical protein
MVFEVKELGMSDCRCDTVVIQLGLGDQDYPTNTWSSSAFSALWKLARACQGSIGLVEMKNQVEDDPRPTAITVGLQLSITTLRSKVLV